MTIFGRSVEFVRAADRGVRITLGFRGLSAATTVGRLDRKRRGTLRNPKVAIRIRLASGAK